MPLTGKIAASGGSHDYPASTPSRERARTSRSAAFLLTWQRALSLPSPSRVLGLGAYRIPVNLQGVQVRSHPVLLSQHDVRVSDHRAATREDDSLPSHRTPPHMA